MWKRAFLLVLLALPALAQFTSLATTRDGSRLYFTSRLVQPGSEQPAHGKVFVLDSNGITPLVIRNRELQPSSLDSLFTGNSNSYDMVGVQPNGDGSQLAVVSLRECSGGNVCVSNDLRRTVLYNGHGEEVLSVTGQLTLSPNGNWGLLNDASTAFPANITAIRLSDGTRFPVSLPDSFSKRWRPHGIANNGSIVLATSSSLTPGELALFRPDAPLVTVPAQAESATVDAQGTTVVWAERGTAGRHLRLLRPQGGLVSVPLTAETTDSYAPALSEDGTRILYLSVAAGRAQAFIMQSDGSIRRQLITEPEGIEAAVLSGDGRTAWVLTRTGRILRITVDTNSHLEVIAKTPAFTTDRITAAAGQPVEVPASIAAGERVSVDINGLSAPVLRADDGRLTFQVPWELQMGVYAAAIRTEANSGWSGATLRVFTVDLVPSFVASSNTGYAIAAHQNFEGPVTQTAPARLGEIIHFYGTGLGAVTPPVSTGTPAPVSPLSLVEKPMRCSAQHGIGLVRTPIDVLFAGLAPGMIGYYQISLRLPETLPSSSVLVNCEVLLSPGGGVGFNTRVPVQAR